MKLEEKALVLEVEDNINRHIISDDLIKLQVLNSGIRTFRI